MNKQRIVFLCIGRTVKGLVVQEEIFGFFSIHPTTPSRVFPSSKVTTSLEGQSSPFNSVTSCTMSTPPLGAKGVFCMASIESTGIATTL